MAKKDKVILYEGTKNMFLEVLKIVNTTPIFMKYRVTWDQQTFDSISQTGIWLFTIDKVSHKDWTKIKKIFADIYRQIN